MALKPEIKCEGGFVNDLYEDNLAKRKRFDPPNGSQRHLVYGLPTFRKDFGAIIRLKPTEAIMATKRGNRRKSSGRAKKGGGGGLLPWYAGAVLVIGGIVAYDHWGELKPRIAATAHMAAATRTPSRPHQERPVAEKPALAAASVAKPRVSSSLPVPPAAIPVSAPTPTPIPSTAPTPAAAPAPAVASESFGLCGEGVHFNCVADGDTFWVRGVKIRIADIDTPDIGPATCPEEQRRGLAAKVRLLALLNAGSFSLQADPHADEKDGQKLRVIYRGGRSIGMQLVGEGLARPWDGSHKAWCT
jgi:endonuclease YncB( thermonuclease family)